MTLHLSSVVKSVFFATCLFFSCDTSLAVTHLVVVSCYAPVAVTHLVVSCYAPVAVTHLVSCYAPVAVTHLVVLLVVTLK